MSARPHIIACIVLAAGGGKRFQGSKQLELLNGETLIHRAVRSALECGPRLVILVTGSGSPGVIDAVADLKPVVPVVNVSWESGLASSIQEGLRELERHDPVDGVMLTLSDQPLVDARCLESLVAEFDSDHRLVAASYDGTVGAPAIIGTEYLSELLNLRGDQGAKAFFLAHIDAVTLVAMPEASADVDTPADLSRLEMRFR